MAIRDLNQFINVKSVQTNRSTYTQTHTTKPTHTTYTLTHTHPQHTLKVIWHNENVLHLEQFKHETSERFRSWGFVLSFGF